MTMFNDFKNHTDQWGLIKGHGIRTTSEYVVALCKHASLIKQERIRLYTVFKKCLLSPGVSIRSPDNAGGYESGDNIIGRITASYLLQTFFPDNFLKHGIENGADHVDTAHKSHTLNRVLYFILSLGGIRKIKYVYNNVDPGGFNVSSWIGRYPQIIAHARFADNKKPTLFQFFMWIIAILQGSFSKKQDSKVLSWFMVLVGINKNWITKLLCKFWTYKLKKHYSLGIGEVLGDYYHPEHYRHPCSIWLHKEFGDIDYRIELDSLLVPEHINCKCTIKKEMQ